MADLHPALEHRFNTVRELYTEFFMLLTQSVSEEPEAGRSGTLDRTIELLMRTIEDEMADFLREVDEKRAAQTPGEPVNPPLSEAIMTFDRQLREGLELMTQCVQRRIAQLDAARESLKARLQVVQAKKRGARGYRASGAVTRLVESHI